MKYKSLGNIKLRKSFGYLFSYELSIPSIFFLFVIILLTKSYMVEVLKLKGKLERYFYFGGKDLSRDAGGLVRPGHFGWQAHDPVLWTICTTKEVGSLLNCITHMCISIFCNLGDNCSECSEVHCLPFKLMSISRRLGSAIRKEIIETSKTVLTMTKLTQVCVWSNLPLQTHWRNPWMIRILLPQVSSPCPSSLSPEPLQFAFLSSWWLNPLS